MLNRKQLPAFAVLNDLQFDIQEIIHHCEKHSLFNFDKYIDINYSAQTHMSKFVFENQFSRHQFFSEKKSDFLEGEKYKQLYLTEYAGEVIKENKDSKDALFTDKVDNIFFRSKRLDPKNARYSPIADEKNYGQRNRHVQGIFEKILDSFKSPVTRVRLAYLSPHFQLKPHVDYDPSYITRYHIPILTNELCSLHVIKNKSHFSTYFPADGRVYFLNTGLLHWAVNDSDCPRLHLIIDTFGQKDLSSGFVYFGT